MFKEKCTEFLDSITQMRETEIERNIQDALQKEHIPYVDELNKTKKLLIEEETQKAEEEIKRIRERLLAKVEAYEAKAKTAIQEDKEKVIQKAKRKAKEKYDNFILGVSRLVDETEKN